MSKSGLEALFGIFIILFIVFGVFSIVSLKEVGAGEIKPVEQKFGTIDYCNAEHFHEDYGEFGAEYSLTSTFVDGRRYFFIKFEDGWITPVENRGGECYFVEEPLLSKKVFRSRVYYESLKDISANFYSPLIMCNRQYAGAEKICGITTTITNLVESQEISLIAHVSESTIDEIANEFEAKNWQRLVGKVGIKFAKTIEAQNGTVLYVTIELLKYTSCDFAKSVNLQIFNLSNDVNQQFTNAKNNYFEKNTITDIEQSNLQLLSISNIPEVDIIRDFLTNIANKVTGEEYCNELKPKELVEQIITSTSNVNLNSEIVDKNFQTRLVNLKAAAQKQMDIENNVKYSNLVKNFNFLKVVPVYSYFAMNSGSAAAFQKQEYITAKEKAVDGTMFYNNYWNETTGLELIPIAAIIALLAFGVYSWKKSE